MAMYIYIYAYMCVCAVYVVDIYIYDICCKKNMNGNKSIVQSIFLNLNLYAYDMELSSCLSIFPSNHLSVCLPIYLSIFLSTYPSVRLSIYRSIIYLAS